MLNRFARALFTRLLTPVAAVLLRLGVSPDAVTLVGTLGVSAGALWLYPTGHLLAGTLVITAFVFSDTVDGIMARSSGRSSSWGAYLDSTLDRVGDAAVFGGLVLWFTGGGADRLTAVLVTAGLVGLGLPRVVLTVVLALLALASLVTVVQRMLEVRRQA